MKNLSIWIAGLFLFLGSAHSSHAGDVHQCNVRREFPVKPDIGYFFIDIGAKFIIEIPIFPASNEPTGHGIPKWDTITLKRDLADMRQLKFVGKDKGRHFSAEIIHAERNPVGKGGYEVSIRGFVSGDSQNDGRLTHQLRAICHFHRASTEN